VATSSFSVVGGSEGVGGLGGAGGTNGQTSVAAANGEDANAQGVCQGLRADTYDY